MSYNRTMSETIKKKPDWFVLMREWRAQNHGDRGITLPFLVGALAHKRNKSQPTLEDVKSLFHEMVTKPLDDFTTEVGWCSTLGAPVLAATPAPPKFTSKVGFRHPSQDWLCVVFGEELQRHWRSSDADELAEKLIWDANEAIVERKYSRDSKSNTYREFEKWEKRFIEQTIMVSDRRT
jgi:hypothetical protein